MFRWFRDRLARSPQSTAVWEPSSAFEFLPPGQGRRVLVVDDNHLRHTRFDKDYPDDRVTHVFSAKEAVEQLEAQRFDVIQLDYDLYLTFLGGGFGYSIEEHSGWPVAVAVAQIEEPRPRVVVHSRNPKGARRMYLLLRNAGFAVIYDPYSRTPNAAYTLDRLRRAFPEGYPPPHDVE